MAAVLIDPFDSNHLMYGTGATIWATDTLSRVDSNWGPTWYIKAQGIEETAVLALASPTEGAHLLSGLGDINGFAHFDLDVPQAPFGIPGFSNLDTLDWAGQAPNVIVRGGDSGVSYADGCGSGTYSTDGGLGWIKFPACAPGIGNQTTFAGLIAVDASAKSFVWATQIQAAPYNLTGPVSSQDLGVTWTAPKGLGFQTGNLSSDKVQPKTFYAIEDGTWYISTDGGVNYKSSPASKTGLPVGSGAVPVVNFGKAGEIWLPLGVAGLYHSTDFGSSWKKIGPSGLVAELATVGKAAPGQSSPAIFIYGKAANSGALSAVNVYRSDDGGSTWTAVTDVAHQYGGAVLIQGDPRVYGRVYMGFFGRGIIYADLVSGKGNVPGTTGL
jgi:oligoxyloglucan reducing-end-specific cellobiohydrolase